MTFEPCCPRSTPSPGAFGERGIQYVVTRFEFSILCPTVRPSKYVPGVQVGFLGQFSEELGLFNAFFAGGPITLRGRPVLVEMASGPKHTTRYQIEIARVL